MTISQAWVHKTVTFTYDYPVDSHDSKEATNTDEIHALEEMTLLNSLSDLPSGKNLVVSVVTAEPVTDPLRVQKIEAYWDKLNDEAKAYNDKMRETDPELVALAEAFVNTLE